MPSKLVSTTIVAVIVLAIAQADSVDAQLFGSRSIKRNINRQSSNSVGLVEGNERFVRGSRRNSFVGADQRDMQGFVGNEQARTSGRIASPTAGIERFVDRSAQINQAVPALKENELYPGPILLPKELILAISKPANPQEFSVAMSTELKKKVNGSIEVSVSGRSARLLGEVTTANEKSLAELLIRFEPGIDEVRNEIVVIGR